jgi:hypothetical protein
MEDVDSVLVLPTPMLLVDWASKARFPLALPPQKPNRHHLPRGSKVLPRRHLSRRHVKVMMVASLDVVDSTLGDVLALLLL